MNTNTGNRAQNRPKSKTKNGKSQIRRPKKSHSSLKLIPFLLIILIIALIAMVIYALNYKPQVNTDDPLPFDISGQPSDAPNSSGNAPSNAGSSQSDSDETDDVKPEGNTENISGYVRNDLDTFNFLVIGKDRVALNTDVIMLVSFDVKSGDVAIMQIPRDTYIEVNNISHKINSVYAAMYLDAYRKGDPDPVKTGMEAFVSVIEKNMKVNIDYYALMQLEGFVKIIDILGGVEIDVPFDMNYNDPDQDLYIHIKAGLQTLTGEQSEQFVRFRSGYVEGDVGRVNAQKLFMSALLKEVKTSVNIFNVGSLAKEIFSNLTTSMSLNDIIYFAKKGFGVDMDKLVMITLPGTEARADVDSGAWYYVMHRADSLKLINKYFNVYDKDISDNDFDNRYAFTNESREHMHKIYLTPAVTDETSLYKTADEIDKNSIYIPLVK